MTCADSAAAVFHGPGATFSIERFPLPNLTGSEVLARIRCATICGSDLHSFFGRRPSAHPCVLGHEMVATVAATGPSGAWDYRGNALAVGDRITWSIVRSCGKCFYCSRDFPAGCDSVMKFGHTKIAPGQELTGGMAEYCHLPEHTAIFRIPTQIPDAVASPANCATATVAACFRLVDGPAVVIHGVGMLGVTACAMAAVGGNHPIIVVEPDAVRRETARQFGATEVVSPSDAPEAVAQLTGGRLADVALEFSGVPEAVELGPMLLRPTGIFIMAGSTFSTRPVSLFADRIVKHMLRISGVYNYSPADLETALKFLAEACARYPFAELVQTSFPLDQIDAAFEHAERMRPLRVAIVPQHQQEEMR